MCGAARSSGGFPNESLRADFRLSHLQHAIDPLTEEHSKMLSVGPTPKGRLGKVLPEHPLQAVGIDHYSWLLWSSLLSSEVHAKFLCKPSRVFKEVDASSCEI
mmetsp:Transcript_159450/g.387137  ORF Transcript_159450/g.387137 Transcript_159450/m.387137 type:complete len:103 (-) Transcript_159450:749-1057(-)